MNNPFPFYKIGHFINQPNNPTELEITRFESMPEPEVEDPHKHTFYEILWVEEGSSVQLIDDQEYHLSPGVLFFISPGQLHQFEAWQHLKGGSVLFTEDFFLMNQNDRDQLFELSFLDNFYVHPILQPDKRSFREILHSIELLEAEKQRPDYSERIAQSLLHILLLQIQRCIDAQEKQPISKAVLLLYKKFKKLIDEHYREPLTVRDYAAYLHVSAHHLNQVVKRLSGKTATELIRARNLLEARRLLGFSEATITEIALYLGYSDSSYFARLFRQEIGRSPLDYRREKSEKYRTRPNPS